AAFELRRRPRRTENAQTSRREEIDDATIERQFGTDNREIDLFALGQGGERAEIIRGHVHISCEVSGAGIARRAQDCANGGFRSKLPRERVFAAASPDNEHIHEGINKSKRVSELGNAVATRSGAGSFIDAGRAFCLESAFTYDSVAYSVGLK